MTEPRDASKVEELFHAALCRPSGERAAFLTEACGADAGLLEEVRSLLDLASDARQLLEHPAAEALTEPLAVARGTRLGPYEVLDRVGAGGMGEVYRARDTRLGRDVAIKVLRGRAATEPEARSRFEREARAVARLNHPHVCTVHDVGRHENTDYLVLELVEGETLAERLGRTALPLDRALRYAIQTAEGLEAAHAQRIVHRDLKPGNILVNERDQVKVMDFGLAKTFRGESGAVTGCAGVLESATPDGAVFGTTSYMSPEQARGDSVDARTDVWAFGCVLYELLTARRAFARETASDTLVAILEREPEWEALPGATPSAVRRLLRRCLEKDRNRRLRDIAEARIALEETLRELPPPRSTGAARRNRLGILLWGLAILAALGWWAFVKQPPAPAPPEIRSIAVLPLDNLTEDSDEGYMVAGMHEALITELSRISALAVVARTSSLRYEEGSRSITEIADELHIDAVVTGSVLRVGDTVRVTVRLVEGRSGRYLWAESFDRQLRNILALYSDVARAVAREIRVAVTPGEQASLARAEPVDPDAYDLYLRGRYGRLQETPQSLESAERYFRAAIEARPDFAQAWAGLAQTLFLMGANGVLPWDEPIPEVRRAVERALLIDGAIPEAHVAAGLVRSAYDLDWPAAEREFLRALELEPGHWNARREYAQLLTKTGRLAEAQAQFERILERDPLSGTANAQAGEVLFYRHELDQAMQRFERANELFEGFFSRGRGITYVTAILVAKGVSFDEIEEALSPSSENPLHRACLAYARAASGQRAEALKLLEGSGDAAPRGGNWWIAAVYASLGNRDAAFAFLERSDAAHEQARFRIKVNWVFDPLRGDARFDALLRRLGLESREGEAVALLLSPVSATWPSLGRPLLHGSAPPWWTRRSLCGFGARSSAAHPCPGPPA